MLSPIIKATKYWRSPIIPLDVVPKFKPYKATSMGPKTNPADSVEVAPIGLVEMKLSHALLLVLM